MQSYMSVREVADKYKVSKSLVYRLLQRGDIPSIRFGGTIRVGSVDLEGYLARCQREGTNQRISRLQPNQANQPATTKPKVQRRKGNLLEFRFLPPR